MEKTVKPENLYIGRKRWLPALAAVMFIIFGVFTAIAPIWVVKYPPEDGQTFILLCIAFPLVALYLLSAAALNIRNLFFPYILTSDEKGIYIYAGLFHYGFIGWEDIAAFSTEAGILDFLDNETPCVKVFLRNKSGLSFRKKWLLFWSGGKVKIFTLCSQIKNRQLVGLLKNALEYYGANDETKVENE